MAVVNVTLNPNDMNAGHTLTNGNLTDTSVVTFANIRATHGKEKGKWYWEVRLNSGENQIIVGIANLSFPIASTALNGGGDALFYRGYRGSAIKYPEAVAYGSTLVVGDVIGVALDLDNSKLEFYRNGISMGVSHTDISILGVVFPFFRSVSTISKTFTVNFGATAFAYPIPSGYQAYNIYLADKVLLSSSDGKFAVSNVTEDSTSDYVPTLSSAIDIPLGITTSASTNTTTSFNTFNDTQWQAVSVSTGWLRIQFPTPTLIGAFSSVGWTNASQNPSKIVFKGSSDGVNWTIIDTFSSLTWTTAVEKKFITSNTKPYSYYEFSDMTCVTAPLTLSKVEMYERIIKNKITKINAVDVTEDMFIKYGLTKESDTTKIISLVEDVCVDANVLGSGKTFEHIFDLNKRSTQKISFQ